MVQPHTSSRIKPIIHQGQKITPGDKPGVFHVEPYHEERTPERFAKKEGSGEVFNVDINGKPYKLIKNTQGYGVIPTSSASDRFHRNYQVVCNQEGMPMRCSCPDAVYRNRECKHMRAVAAIASHTQQPTTQQQEEKEKGDDVDNTSKKMSRASMIGAARRFAKEDKKKKIDRGDGKTAIPPTRKITKPSAVPDTSGKSDAVESAHQVTGDKIGMKKIVQAMGMPKKPKPPVKPLRDPEAPAPTPAAGVIGHRPEGIKWSPAKTVGDEMHPALKGSRLAVILKEIANKQGRTDKELGSMVRDGMKNYADRNIAGSKLWNGIRDRLMALGNRGDKRASKLALEYNWHRIHPMMEMDKHLQEHIKSVLNVKNENERNRLAHNLFGHGWEQRSDKYRGKIDQNVHDKFWQSFHDKMAALNAKLGNIDMRAITPLAMKNSLRRIAQNEENIHGNPSKTVMHQVAAQGKGNLGLGMAEAGPKAKFIAPDIAGQKPAWTEKGGKITHRPSAQAGQYARLSAVRRYAMQEVDRNLEEENIPCDHEGYKDLLSCCDQSYHSDMPLPVEHDDAGEKSDQPERMAAGCKSSYSQIPPQTSMKKSRRLGTARRMARNPSPFYQAHHETGGDHTPLLALADSYDEGEGTDAGDFRGQVIRRALGQTQHPQGYTWGQSHNSPFQTHGTIEGTEGNAEDPAGLSQVAASAVSFGEERSPQGVAISILHRGKSPTGKESFYANGEKRSTTPALSRSAPQQTTRLTGVFTPQEVREMAHNMQDQESASHLHEFLDRHFPQSRRAAAPTEPTPMQRARYSARGKPKRYSAEQLAQTEQGFHQMMVDTPNDSNHHGVYGDWLSEHAGRPGHGEVESAAAQHGVVGEYPRNLPNLPKTFRINYRIDGNRHTVHPNEATYQVQISYPILGESHWSLATAPIPESRIAELINNLEKEGFTHASTWGGPVDEDKVRLYEHAKSLGAAPAEATPPSPDTPPETNEETPERFAMAAPAGDLIVGYNNYKGGQRIPSKNGGEYVKAASNPPRLNPAKFEAKAAAVRKWNKKFPKPRKVKWVPDATPLNV